MGTGKRKTKYDLEIFPKLELIGVWKQNGLTNEEIWGKLGISKNTFYKYKNEHPEFREVIENGSEEADAKVQNSAFKMATGHFVKVPEYFKERRICYDDHGRKCEEEVYVEKEVTRYIPPSPTMNIFWLKNRDPKNWNKQPTSLNDDEMRSGIIEIPMAEVDTSFEVIEETAEKGE